MMFSVLLLALPGASMLIRTARCCRAAFREQIRNIPGKSIVAVVVSYPPGGKIRSHREAAQRGRNAEEKAKGI